MANKLFMPYPGAHPIPTGRSPEPLVKPTYTAPTPNTRFPIPYEPMVKPTGGSMFPGGNPTGKIPYEPITKLDPGYVNVTPGPGSASNQTFGNPNTPQGDGVPVDKGYVLGGGPGHIPIGQRPYEPLTGFNNLQGGAPHLLGNTGQGTHLHSWDSGHLLPSKHLEGQPIQTRSDRWPFWQALLQWMAARPKPRHFTLNQTQGDAEVSVSPGDPSGIGGPVGYY